MKQGFFLVERDLHKSSSPNGTLNALGPPTQERTDEAILGKNLYRSIYLFSLCLTSEIFT